VDRELLVATAEGDLAAVKGCFNDPANLPNVDALNGYGDSALHISAETGRFEMVQYLVSMGAVIDTACSSGATPFLISSRADHLKVTGFLLEKGANIDSRDHTGSTALHYSAMRGNLEMVEYLVNAGAEIGALDDQGDTPLHHSARWGHRDIAKFLLKTGAKIDLQNYAGWTALLLAARYDNESVVRYLLEFGADATITNKKGAIALDHAGNDSIIKLLEQPPVVHHTFSRATVQSKSRQSGPTSPSIREQEVCRTLRAHMLYYSETGMQEKTMTVYDLIYTNTHTEKTDETEGLITRTANRWIHLPANNVCSHIAQLKSVKNANYGQQIKWVKVIKHSPDC
jgi:ankyrin repeat protein